MRDEKEERKKQARSNKQTRQSNTAHPRHMYMYRYRHVQHSQRNLVGQCITIFEFFSISVTLSPYLQLTPDTSQGGGGGASVHVVHLPSTQKSPIVSEVAPKVTQYFSVQTADDLEATPTSPTRLSVKRLSVDLRRQPAEKMAPEG